MLYLVCISTKKQFVYSLIRHKYVWSLLLIGREDHDVSNRIQIGAGSGDISSNQETTCIITLHGFNVNFFDYLSKHLAHVYISYSPLWFFGNVLFECWVEERVRWFNSSWRLSWFDFRVILMCPLWLWVFLLLLRSIMRQKAS